MRDDAGAWIDAPVRHHCYELHIGLTALAWNVWAGDSEALQQVATQLAVVLERGPLPADAITGIPVSMANQTQELA